MTITIEVARIDAYLRHRVFVDKQAFQPEGGIESVASSLASFLQDKYVGSISAQTDLVSVKNGAVIYTGEHAFCVPAGVHLDEVSLKGNLLGSLKESQRKVRQLVFGLNNDEGCLPTCAVDFCRRQGRFYQIYIVDRKQIG